MMMKLLLLLVSIICITSTTAQQYIYNTSNDARCLLSGGGCDFMDETLWETNTAPSMNSSVLIQSSSPILISLNSSTSFLLYNMSVYGNVTFSVHGNLNVTYYEMFGQTITSLVNGTIHGEYFIGYNSTQLLSSGGRMAIFIGVNMISTQPTMMTEGASFSGLVFASPILYCDNCIMTVASLLSTVLNYTGALDGSVTTMETSGLTVSFYLNTNSLGDISATNGSVTVVNAQMTGTTVTLVASNITFENCNVQASTVSSRQSSNITLLSTNLTVTDYLNSPTIITSGFSSLVILSDYAYINGIIQLDVDDVNANFPIIVDAVSVSIDGTYVPIFLRSSVNIYMHATLVLSGEVTFYPTFNSSSQQQNIFIFGDGILVIGSQYAFDPALVNMTGPLISPQLLVSMVQGILTVPQLEIYEISVNNGDLYLVSSYIVGNVVVPNLSVQSFLHVNGNITVTSTYYHHLRNGDLAVNGTLIIQESLELIEDDGSTLYDLDTSTGVVIIATATSCSNQAVTSLTLADDYFYNEEGFSYKVMNSPSVIMLDFSFSESPTPDPYPDPDNWWFYNYWRYYLIVGVVCLVVSACIRYFIIYQGRRRGYTSINTSSHA